MLCSTYCSQLSTILNNITESCVTMLNNIFCTPLHYMEKNEHLAAMLIKIRLNNVVLPTLSNVVNNSVQNCYI